MSSVKNDLTHPEIELTAPIEHWRALEAQLPYAPHVQLKHVGTPAHPDVILDGEWELYIDQRHGKTATGHLLQGIFHTHSHDERVIMWVLDDLQRRKEETRRVDAMVKQAEAMQALAKAIQGKDQQAFLPQLAEFVRATVREELTGEHR